MEDIHTFIDTKIKAGYKLVKIDDGTLKFIKENIISDVNELSKYTFTHSNITYCVVNDEEIDANKYAKILVNIYRLIDDGVKIIKNTTFNIKTIPLNDKGFTYLDDLGISYQKCDANKTIFEIVNQCKLNNIKLNIKIELQDDTNIIILV